MLWWLVGRNKKASRCLLHLCNRLLLCYHGLLSEKSGGGGGSRRLLHWRLLLLLSGQLRWLCLMLLRQLVWKRCGEGCLHRWLLLRLQLRWLRSH